MRQGKPAGWQRPYLPGALVILPPAEIGRRVQRLRRKCDPESAWSVPPHITLTQPFRVEPDASALASVARIIGRARRFRIRYGPLGSFLPYPCVWYAIAPPRPLLSLRRKLHATGLFNTELPHTDDYVPHMSITDGAPAPDEAARLLQRLRGRVKCGDFDVVEVVYTRPDWRLRFRPVMAFRLRT